MHAKEPIDPNVVATCPICNQAFPFEDVCPVHKVPLRSTDTRVGTVFADRFEILALLGAGGSSFVYKAKHQLMERIVALKLLSSNDLESIKRFKLEAKLACQLNHPNIVSVFDFGLDANGVPYFVMDYLEGQTLADVIDDGPVSFRRALHIFCQAGDALNFAHKRKLIHRDLKPSNLMLVRDDSGQEVLKLFDFGIAKKTSGNISLSITRHGEVIGSPFYMSPEQCRGLKLDARSDIYSLGCVMYEALTGEVAFPGDDMVEVLHRHIKTDPPRFAEVNPQLANLPPKMEEIVFNCLQRDVEKRYQSAFDMWTDLETLASSVNNPQSAARQAPTLIKPKRDTAPGVARPNSSAIHKLRKSPAGAVNQQLMSDGYDKVKITAAVLIVLVVIGGSAFLLMRNSTKQSNAVVPHEVTQTATATVPPENGTWQKLQQEAEREYQNGRYLSALGLFKDAENEASANKKNDASLLVGLAKAYYSEDQYDHCEQALTQALDIRTSENKNSPKVREIKTLLGNLYSATNRKPEAKKVLDDALRTAEEQNANDDIKADTLSALAKLNIKQHQPKEALTLLQKALMIRNQVSPKDDMEKALIENEMGRAYETQGNLAESRKAYSQALQDAQNSVGQNHPIYADSLFGLASINSMENKYEEAKVQYVQSKTIREMAFGPNNLRTAQVLACMGMLAISEKDYAQGNELLNESLKIKRTVLGDNDPEVKDFSALCTRLSHKNKG
jgi:eukaryotic-like serine/threonine-protein kinase